MHKITDALAAGIIFFLLPLNLKSAYSQENSDIELPHIYTYVDRTKVEQREVYTAEDIETSHAENLSSFLQSQGMQLLSYGAYGLESKPSIRGFTDETVRVVIDGICVNNAQYGTFDFNSINISDIEKIEIVRGGFTEDVSDEGAVAGVIYITTKNQVLGTSVFTDTLYKTFFYKNLPVDTFSQKLGINIELTENDYLKLGGAYTNALNEYFYHDYKGKKTVQTNSGVQDGSVDLIYTKFWNGGNNFSVSENFYGGEKNTPGTKSSGSAWAGVQSDYDNRLFFTLRNPSVKNTFKLDTNLGWLFNKRTYVSSTDDSLHYINTVSFVQKYEFFRKGIVQENAGLSFDYVYLDSTDDGIHYLLQGAVKSTSKFYFNDVINLSVPLCVKFSGKNFEFVPKIGASFSFKYLQLKADFYRVVQFPNMDDLYWNGSGYKGNPNLKPENGVGGEITFNVYNIAVPFSVCIYSNYYADKIQWAGNTVENVSSAFYCGIDGHVEKSFLQEKITLRLNVEYLYNRLLDKSNSRTYGKRIMWTPDLVGGFSFLFNPGLFTFQIDGSYVGKRYVSNLNAGAMEPYFLLNASGQYNGKHIIPYFRIENILNADYEAVDNYAMPGISMTLGFKTKY